MDNESDNDKNQNEYLIFKKPLCYHVFCNCRATKIFDLKVKKLPIYKEHYCFAVGKFLSFDFIILTKQSITFENSIFFFICTR